MSNDPRRPRARFATLLGVLALIVAGFAVSQVIQVRGSWRDLGETEVRTLEDRVVLLEKELGDLQIALGIEPASSLAQDAEPSASVTDTATVPASVNASQIDAARLQAIDASLEQLDEVRRQLRVLREESSATAAPSPASADPDGAEAAPSTAGEPQ